MQTSEALQVVHWSKELRIQAHIDPFLNISGRPCSRSEIQGSSALSEAKVHGAPLLEATGAARSGLFFSLTPAVVVLCLEQLWEGPDVFG